MTIYNTDSATVRGTDWNDVIISDNPGTLVEDYGGNDQITNIADGNFSANGGAGNDIIINYAQSGSSHLDGEWGDDFLINYVTNSLDVQLIGDWGNDTLMNCGAGMATLDATGGYGDNKILIGGAGVDIFAVDIDRNNTIFNYDSTDVIYCGQALVDTVGTDVIIRSFDGYETTVVKGAAGKPVNVFFDSDDPFYRCIIDSYTDMFTANFYSAQTVEGSYHDTIYGTAFDDTIDNDTEGEVHGLGGNDFITNFAESSEIYGDTGNDVLINSVEVSMYNNYLYGGWGDDVLINEYSFNANLYGEDGNDVIINHASNYSDSDSRILLDGGEGSDTLTSYGFGIATLDGGSLDKANDVLIGGAGVDIFRIGSMNCGVDVISNCSSDDLIYFDGSLSDCSFQVVGADIVVNSVRLSTGNYQGTTLIIQGGANQRLNFFTQDNQHDFNQAIENYKEIFVDYAESLEDDNSTDDNSTDDNSTDDNSTEEIHWNRLLGGSDYSGVSAVDVFDISKNDGNDWIAYLDPTDEINFYNATLSDIVSISISDTAIEFTFDTGDVTRVVTSDDISPTFKLSSGESYVYNRTTDSWQNV
ncbi:MAG: hypothetical protein IJ685_00880 [Selenomonadaceae bacterium]|nr:hypothetical protein [Selenomonadaceae bacterium]